MFLNDYKIPKKNGSQLPRDTSDQNNSPLKRKSSPTHTDEHPSPKQINQDNRTLHSEDKLMAVCTNCGGLSSDKIFCDRCKKALPRDVKLINTKHSPVEPIINKSNFYGSKVQKDFYKQQLARPPIRRVVHKEPVCLTISSDEEEHNGSNANQSDSSSQRLSPVISRADVSTASNTVSSMSEPTSVLRYAKRTGTPCADSSSEVIAPSSDIPRKLSTPDTEVSNKPTKPVSCSVTEINNETPRRTRRQVGKMTDLKPSDYTTEFKCRSIRIGSYKYMCDVPVTVTGSGFVFTASSLEQNITQVVHIPTKDIDEIMFSFSRNLDVMFVTTTVPCAKKICEKLEMKPGSDYYYNPLGNDKTKQKITFLPTRITDEHKVLLNMLFADFERQTKAGKLQRALNYETANRILVSATPKECKAQANILSNSGGKSRSPSPSPPKLYQAVKMIIYPPPPLTSGITITSDDYFCLEQGQFLNDVIIDFYLKYLFQNILSEEDRRRTHIFSSFFYNCLNQRRSSEEPKLPPPELRHHRVKTWTRHVDIFTKDFIIIPINEHSHWFLAIICFPHMNSVNKGNIENNQSKEAHSFASKSNNSVFDAMEGIEEEGKFEWTDTMNDNSKSSLDEEEPMDEAEAKSPLTINNSDDTTTFKQPCILIFDSLAGQNKGRVISALKEYLRIEWRVKKKSERSFGADVMKGSNPKVPQQSNFSDCGVYLLQYVESFFKDPIRNFNLPLKLTNWFSEEVVSRKRKEIQELIDRLKKHQDEVESASTSNEDGQTEELVCKTSEDS